MFEVSESRIYEFEDFRLDAKSHKLFRRAGGELVPLTPKAVELLLFFVRNAGRILSKDEVLDAVWENSFVEEANISQTIFVLRKTLGENTKEPRFILTVPNRGYQFIAEVRAINPKDSILEESLLSEAESPQIQSSKSQIPNPKSQIRNPKLKWLAALAAVLSVAATIVYWFYPAAKPVSVREIKTIAILPFEDLSAGQADKYLGVGLADALANKFGGLKQITVRPTRTVLKYAENREDASKIGRELQVDAVLDGRIQRDGELLRVSVQLIRTADNATLWTENFDDQFTNFFAVQDSISRKILKSLALQLDETEREKFDRRGTQNAAAYQDYLRGQYFWNKRTADNLHKAVEHFELALAKDPNFALAYTGLSSSYQLLAEYGAAAPGEVFPKAESAARKALEIDDRLAEAHTALAYAQAFYAWDWAGAERSFTRALEIDPNYATAHQWYAEYLIARGRLEEARRHLERALEIDPVSPVILSDLAALYDQLDQPDEEIAQARKVIEIDPNFAYGHFYLGLGYERKGMFTQASESLARSMILFGETAECAEEVRAAFAENGMTGWWRKRLEQIETRPHLRNFSAYHKALVKIRLSDREGALEALNQAFERKDRMITNARVEPRLEALRQDSRLQEILRKMGL